MDLIFGVPIPILRIFSVEKATEFYIDFLGFKIDWKHQFDDNSPTYMQVSKGSLLLHLSEHVGDACPGSAVLISVSDVNGWSAELNAKGYKYLRPGVEDAPWGGKLMDLIDPFGNHLRITQSS